MQRSITSGTDVQKDQMKGRKQKIDFLRVCHGIKATEDSFYISFIFHQESFENINPTKPDTSYSSFSIFIRSSGEIEKQPLLSAPQLSSLRNFEQIKRDDMDLLAWDVFATEEDQNAPLGFSLALEMDLRLIMLEWVVGKMKRQESR